MSTLREWVREKDEKGERGSWSESDGSESERVGVSEGESVEERGLCEVG